MRTFFGLLFLLPCVVTAYWWERQGFPWEGERAMYAIVFIFFGLPCGIIGALLLLWRR